MLRRSTSRTKKDDTELDKQIRKLDKSTSTLELSCVEEFPERLLALTKLRSLNVSRSSLVSIPPRISKLDRLETLILQRNRLQRLPEELGLLRNLVILDIGKNQLKYLPDQLNMPALRELMCEMNQLEALPKKLSGIPSLTKVCYKYRTTILLQP
jgi:Leucine-rich repeat (LRR) protein